jgi:hypothetical protein
MLLIGLTVSVPGVALGRTALRCAARVSGTKLDMADGLWCCPQPVGMGSARGARDIAHRSL